MPIELIHEVLTCNALWLARVVNVTADLARSWFVGTRDRPAAYAIANAKVLPPTGRMTAGGCGGGPGTSLVSVDHLAA